MHSSTMRFEMVGLFCTTLFAAALFVMLLSVSPALVRVTTYIVVDKNLQNWRRFASPVHEMLFKKSLLIIMAWGSMLAPLLCCLPLLICYQFFGDALTGACFICFTILPITAAFTATASTIRRSYFLYLLWYFLPLGIVLVVEARKHHFSKAVDRQLKNPMTYVEIAAEISLANVVVSDVLYIALSSSSRL
eukprot:m.376567 g.376567  ORF g.376567 m.376567 type:complete len:191 (+) comp28195_c1_seq6:1891-2463(+)